MNKVVLRSGNRIEKTFLKEKNLVDFVDGNFVNLDIVKDVLCINSGRSNIVVCFNKRLNILISYLVPNKYPF